MFINAQAWLTAVALTAHARFEDARNNDEGQALAEYGLILALIAVVAIASLVLLGKQVNAALSSITAKLPAVS